MSATGISNSRGIGLVGAVFLITVIALLVVAITRSVRTQGDAYAIEGLSSRAFFAAETGAQLAVREIYPTSGGGSCANRTWTLESIGLQRCQAVTQCRAEIVGGVPYYSVESAGRCTDGGTMAAERVVLVRTRS